MEPARPATPRLDNWSPPTRSEVKQAFSAVKCDAFWGTHPTFGNVLHIRPRDLVAFRLKLAGLQTDVWVQAMLGHLTRDKGYWVRWASKGMLTK